MRRGSVAAADVVNEQRRRSLINDASFIAVRLLRIAFPLSFECGHVTTAHHVHVANFSRVLTFKAIFDNALYNNIETKRSQLRQLGNYSGGLF